MDSISVCESDCKREAKKSFVVVSHQSDSSSSRTFPFPQVRSIALQLLY